MQDCSCCKILYVIMLQTGAESSDSEFLEWWLAAMALLGQGLLSVDTLVSAALSGVSPL